MNPVGKSQREEMTEFLAATDKVQAVKNEIEARVARVQQFGERIDVPTLESWRVRLAEANLTFGSLRDIALEGAALHGELEALQPPSADAAVPPAGDAQREPTFPTGSAVNALAIGDESVGG